MPSFILPACASSSFPSKIKELIEYNTESDELKLLLREQKLKKVSK